MAPRRRKRAQPRPIELDGPIDYLTADELKAVYARIVDKYRKTEYPVVSPGILQPTRFEACLLRPKAGFGDHEHFPDIFAKAAAYAHSIICDHIFVDGNKRTGMEAAFAFLEKNKYIVEIEAKEYVRIALKVALGEWGVEGIRNWFSDNARRYDDWMEAHLRGMAKNGKYQEKRWPYRRHGK